MNMAKTKLAVIQDDILAVKHALANNLSFEGLQGEPLNNVLQTLLAQRAQAAIAATSGSYSASPCPSSGSASGGGGSSSNGSSSNMRIPVNEAAPKGAAAKKGKKRPSSSPPSITNDSSPASNKTPQTIPPKASPPSAAKTPAPEKRRQASSGKAAKKARTPGSGSSSDRLRQLRKSIKIGDTLSVLMDINIGGIWEKEWVEGEVVREVRHATDGYVAQTGGRTLLSTPVKLNVETCVQQCVSSSRRRSKNKVAG